jgi:hypothetical protein
MGQDKATIIGQLAECRIGDRDRFAAAIARELQVLVPVDDDAVARAGQPLSARRRVGNDRVLERYYAFLVVQNATALKPALLSYTVPCVIITFPAELKMPPPFFPAKLLDRVLLAMLTVPFSFRIAPPLSEA